MSARRIICAVCALACLATPASALQQNRATQASPAARPAPPIRPADLDRIIRPFAEAGHFSGVVLVTDRGRIVYERAFGMADAELNVRNSLATLFGIASITKTMTSLILDRMVEDGVVSLSDPVSRYVPGLPDGDRITLDMLARHRSGIRHRVTTTDEEAAPIGRDQLIERIRRTGLAFAPGTGRLYSSTGYAVLAYALETASGRSYGDLLRHYVFAPAGMTGAAQFDGDALMAGRAKDYLPSPTGLRNAPYKDYSFLIGAGSVFSSARDLLRFGQAEAAGRFGNIVRTRAAPNGVFAANGFTGGHRGYIRLDGNTGRGLVLLSNLNSGANDLIIRGIEALLAGQAPPPAALPDPVLASGPAADVSRYAGAYGPRENQPGIPFELIARNVALYIGDYRLFPMRNGCFFEYQFYGELCFTAAQGQPLVVRWQAPTFSMEMVRIAAP